jgi:N-methylhydantoinase A
MKLSARAARDALRPIADALDTSSEKTADGVLAVVNENMAAAARVHVAERGFDASRFALLVTGGGGPLHGCDVARRLGITRVVCPPGAGVASALGLLIAPARVDRSVTLARSLSAVTPEALETAFAKLEADAAGVMKDTLVEDASYRFERSADIRFVGQGFELVTRLPDGPFDADTPARIREAFAAAYGRVFSQVPPVQNIELMNLRVAAIETGVERPLNLAASGRETWKPGAGNRDVWQAAQDKWRNVETRPIEAMKEADRLAGPAIVEDASSTLIIPAGATAWRDAAGNLIVDLEPQRHAA